MRLNDAMPETEFTLDESTGFLTARGVLARTGIQNYRAVEIGLNDDDPMRIIRVYRPHSEVFDKQSVLSFENRPLTVEHPGELVTADNWRQYAVGEVRDVKREGDYLTGTVIVKDADTIAKIQNGLLELSNGYTNLLDFTPGTTPGGESYDAIQRQIRGNHVALVKRARCGSACRLTGDENMEDENMDELQKQLDEANARIKELEDELGTKTAESESKDAKIEELSVKVSSDSEKITTMLADAQAEIARLSSPEHIATAAKEWAKMIADGAKIDATVTVDGSAIDYQRAVLRKALDSDESRRAMVLAVTGGKTVCDASTEQVQSAFRLLASMPGKTKDSEIGKVLLGKTADAVEVMGAANFHSRMLNGFKGDK